MSSQTYQDKPHIQPSPRQQRQKLDRPQVYGCCSVDQVSSHRDYRELLGSNPFLSLLGIFKFEIEI